MNKTKLLFFFLLCSVFPTGCVIQNQPSPQTEEEDIVIRGYRPWVGPGWYYGVYFSDEWHYRNWRHRHYRRDNRRWGSDRGWNRGEVHRHSGGGHRGGRR